MSKLKLFLFSLVGEKGESLLKKSFYEMYNDDRYVHFRYVPTGKYEVIHQKRNGKVIETRRPIYEKQKLNFDEIKSINLDDYGQDVRSSTDNFTIVHNYFIDYWGAILGIGPVTAYIHLKRYCYAEKDFCFPNLSEIQAKMKIGSRATLTKHLDTLEEYGFIAKIHRYDSKRNNEQVSPFFKIRRFIPLLSEDLYETLPTQLRKRHEEFLAESAGIVLDESTSAEQLIKDMMKNAEAFKSKAEENREDQLKREGKLKEYILTKLLSDELSNYQLLIEALAKKISKPSFDTWFLNSVLLIDEESQILKIYSANSFTSNYLKNNYYNLIEKTVKDELNIKVEVISFLLYENY